MCVYSNNNTNMWVFSPIGFLKQEKTHSCESDFSSTISFLCRLKKKSQSIDITAAGFDPLAPGAPQALQPMKPTSVISTTTSEEEQNNTTNTQRRNPRRGELKRYYTIGELKGQVFLLKHLIGCKVLAPGLMRSSLVGWLGVAEFLLLTRTVTVGIRGCPFAGHLNKMYRSLSFCIFFTDLFSVYYILLALETK